MSTEQQNQAADLEAFLQDPLSMPEGVDLEALAAGTLPEATVKVEQPDGEQQNGQHAAGDDAIANQQGEKGDAPGTKQATEQEQGKQVEQPGVQPSGGQDDVTPAGVASKDGKHIIPYTELSSTRERALRAEAMLEQVLAENAALKSGKAGTAAHVDVDDATLSALREDNPETAELVERLIASNRQLSEHAQAGQQSAVQDQIEQRVQAQTSVEDAINSVPKLAHLRANDQATFTAVAEIDSLLGKQPGWQGKPLPERFAAAVRAYEAVNGDIVLPGQQQAKPNQPVSQQQPADAAARVEAALAKATKADPGPSTLSDIPGGAPAAGSHEDALAQLSEAALLERFMGMSPDQIESELARLS